jgi:hypothetical protein
MTSPKRWPRHLGATLLLVTIAAIGYLYYRYQLEQRRRSRAAEEDLQAALVEADRLDPDWRLEDLETKRRTFNDAENSAVCVRAVARLLPKDFPWDDLLEEPPPNRLLTREKSDRLRRWLDDAAPALDAGRPLLDLSDGRHVVSWANDYVSTSIDHADGARQCANAFQLQAQWRNEENEPAAAMKCCRIILNAGRSIGDEPLTLSQIVRLAIETVAVRSVERTLAQSTPSLADLRVMQKALETEAEHPTLAIMARSERIWVHRLLTGLTDGSLKWSKYDFAGRTAGDADSDPTKDRAMVELAPLVHARVLNRATRLVEIAKLPPHRWKDELEELPKIESSDPAERFLASPEHFSFPCLRARVMLRCAGVALAVERYRRAKGRWPVSLGDLKPDLLVAVPLDPFDGALLRYRQLKDGAVIYSVGPDGKDDGGALEKFLTLKTVGADIGFRLWNENARRLPPLPPKEGN